MQPLRILIDYATGENWQMPAHLYEKYLAEKNSLKSSGKQTAIQAWLAALPIAERKQITPK